MFSVTKCCIPVNITLDEDDLKVTSRRPQDIFGVIISRLPMHLQDVFKISWKTRNCYALL